MVNVEGDIVKDKRTIDDVYKDLKEISTHFDYVRDKKMIRTIDYMEWQDQFIKLQVELLKLQLDERANA